MPSCPMAMPSSTAMVLNLWRRRRPASRSAADQLAQILQVHVARHELGEGAGNGTIGLPNRQFAMPVARAGHVAAVAER